MMFSNKEVLNLGYTAWCLQQLRRPMLIFVEGQPTMLGKRGGVERRLIDACLVRMQCWVRLCKEVVAAEFPNFMVFCAFSVFQLPSARHEGQARDELVSSDHLKRLAQFFEVPEMAFKQQFLDFYNLASMYKGRKLVSE